MDENLGRTDGNDGCGPRRAERGPRRNVNHRNAPPLQRRRPPLRDVEPPRDAANTKSRERGGTSAVSAVSALPCAAPIRLFAACRKRPPKPAAARQDQPRGLAKSVTAYYFLSGSEDVTGLNGNELNIVFA